MRMVLLSIILVMAVLTPVILAQDKSAKPATEKVASKPENIGPEQFDTLRKADTNSTVVLDVRTREEYKAGHIPGSVLIDFNAGDFEQQVAKLDKDKTYLVHCAVGGRSARACKKMNLLGFKKLYNLEGGMGAWEKAGKQVEK
ncbi:MAG TPA: rhodanese-like domain-containing protein [Candidatus Kapabacteria bacterium]|nr:rhodanese-like domain-containing protein [Candidatus Kapabacteria bacterium]